MDKLVRPSRLAIFALVNIILLSSLQAQFRASKISVAFGIVPTGISRIDSFYVKNSYGTAYSVTGITNSSPAFVISAKSGSVAQAITAGDSAWYYITFTPSAITNYSDLINVGHNSPDTTIRVSVSGQGVEHLLTSKPSIAYGTIVVSRNKVDSFYVKNRSTTPYTISAVTKNTAAYTITAKTTLTGTINAGDSLWYYVTFAPTAASSYPDTVKVTHNSNAVNPLRVVLSGAGSVQLVSTKASLAYGTVFVGTTKKDSFYVQSKGLSTDTIKSVIHGKGKDSTLFTFTLPGALPYAITPGDSAKIVVAFAPDTTKAYADTVVVAHSALASPIRVPMSGTGDAQLASSKTAISFGAVAANTPKADSFYVKNRSNSPFTISAVITNTTKYVVSAANMTPTLAAGDSAWYTVTFTPDTLKSFPDTVKITHNAFGVNPIKVILSGTGDVQLVSTKTPLAYGSVLVGSTQADSFYVKNKSNINYNVSAISNLQTARFVLSATPGALNAGDSLKIKVTFTPDSVGNLSDTVSITHNAPFGNPLKVPLSGTGGNPLRLVNRTGATLTVMAMVDTFANKLRKDSVYIRNVGGSGFNVTSVSLSNPEFMVLTQPSSVAAGDSQKVVIGYVASSVGRDVDTLKIVHNSTIPGSSPIVLPVRARGLGSFAWTTVSAGSPMDTNVVRINATNTGTSPGTTVPPLAVDSVRSLTVFLRNNQDRFDPASAIFRVDSIKFTTASFYSVMPVPFSIRPDLFDVYQILLQFRFQPKVASTSLKDTAFLFTNDTVPGGNIVRIPVEGSSRNVAYILTDRNRQDMNFGSVAVYGASADSAVRVHNYKTTGTTIDSVKLAQKNAFFKVDTISLYKRVLAQGDTSRILVRFAPSDTTPTVGATNRDTLLIYNTGSGLTPNPYKIPLAGAPALGISQLPNVTSINFGESTVGIYRDTVIKIYNRTRANYQIDSIGLFSAQNYSVRSNVLVTTMNAGDSTAIQLRFLPLAGGTLTDTLYVYHKFPTTLFANPRKITLTGSGSTQQLIDAANYYTVDNVQGTDGVPIMSPDSSYKEKGNFWSNTGSSVGAGHRRSPNLSGSNFGSEATWTFKIDSTAPYLIYHGLIANSPNVGGGYYVYFRKFGIGGIFDSVRYNGYANRTFQPGVATTWMPLMMHRIDGVGDGAARVSIGADEKSGGFLRVDAIRLLRSRQRRDLEFGRRALGFTSERVREEFPEVTLGDSSLTPYRLYNLGYDTLKITNISFYKTSGSTASGPRFFVKGYTPGSTINIPPMTVNAQNQEVGGYYDMQLVFAPFQEEIVRDSMVITSNDDNEPNASIVMIGQGINYYFIMNASSGGQEPHYRAPAPGQGGVTTLPIYRETANGSWLNSTLAAVTYPIPGGNVSSRVNTGGTASLPHQAFYEFELPDLAFGRIPTDGNYIFEYGGPAGSPNGYSLSQTVVTQSFGVRPDTGYYSGTTAGDHLWLQIGGTLKTFPLFPGGKITVEVARTAQTDALGGVGVLRTDLLRVRKVPTGSLIGLSSAAPDSINFGEVNFRSPGGIDGKANKKVLTIGSRGEKALRVSQLRFRDGRFFRLAPSPALPFDLPAINGNYNLTVEFVPNKIQSSYYDTLEVYSNSSRQDTLLLVRVWGAGVGQSFVIHDDGVFNQEIAAVPFPGALYLGGWDKNNLKSWYVHAVNTADSIGLGKTRRLLPIYSNNSGWFEWYPLLPTASGSDSMFVRVFATVTANATNLSPAARYKVWSTGGRLTLDTTMNQNGRAVTRQGVAEIDLGSHYFLRGGRDAAGGAAVFGHVRVEDDTTAVTAFYGGGTNVAKRDTFGLVADAIILRELEFPGVATGIEEVKDLPREYTLAQNFPNPFNPTTTINFTLPERVGVSLKIYDILGREVATLLHGDEMNPGKYSVRWLGRTDYGVPVSTGVYFYRIVAGGFVQVKKMILLK